MAQFCAGPHGPLQVRGGLLPRQAAHLRQPDGKRPGRGTLRRAASAPGCTRTHLQFGRSGGGPLLPGTAGHGGRQAPAEPGGYHPEPAPQRGKRHGRPPGLPPPGHSSGNRRGSIEGVHSPRPPLRDRPHAGRRAVAERFQGHEPARAGSGTEIPEFPGHPDCRRQGQGTGLPAPAAHAEGKGARVRRLRPDCGPAPGRLFPRGSHGKSSGRGGLRGQGPRPRQDGRHRPVLPRHLLL